MASSRGRTYDEGPGEAPPSPREGVERPFGPDSILGYIAIQSDEIVNLRERVDDLIEAIDPIMIPERSQESKTSPEADRLEFSHVAELIENNTRALRHLQRRVAEARERVQF